MCRDVLQTLKLYVFIYDARHKSWWISHVFRENRLRRIRRFIAGWIRVGRQRRRPKVLVVNAQRQSDDNLRHLDPG